MTIDPDLVPAASDGEQLCAALRRQAQRAGVDLGDEPLWSAATLHTQLDPYSQECSIVATWRGGARFGTATFFPSGRVFAEYQVLLPAPCAPGHWVEAVQVWGALDALRGDIVLCTAPS